jgi:hypothetical protein
MFIAYVKKGMDFEIVIGEKVWKYKWHNQAICIKKKSDLVKKILFKIAQKWDESKKTMTKRGNN